MDKEQIKMLVKLVRFINQQSYRSEEEVVVRIETMLKNYNDTNKVEW